MQMLNEIPHVNTFWNNVYYACNVTWDIRGKVQSERPLGGAGFKNHSAAYPLEHHPLLK